MKRCRSAHYSYSSAVQSHPGEQIRSHQISDTSDTIGAEPRPITFLAKKMRCSKGLCWAAVQNKSQVKA
jgi:hypothetical protein